METKTAEGTVEYKPVNEMSYDAAHLDVVVLNKSETPQKVNLLSNYEEDNQNCEYSVGQDPKLYQYAKRVLLSKHYFFDAIRLQTDNDRQFENHIDIVVRGVNGAQIGIPIYPLAYMSPNQFQRGVVDIRIPLSLDGMTEFQTELIKGVAVIFMKQMSSKTKESPEEKAHNRASDERRLWFPISFENITDADIEYNLCFYFSETETLKQDSGIKVKVGNGATLLDLTKQLVDTKSYVVFKSVHACSNDKQFFNSNIEFYNASGEKTIFKLIDLMNVMELVDTPTEKTIVTGQFLTHMTEFNAFHPINTSNKDNMANIKFTVPAKTKIIYFIKTEENENNN